MTVYKITVATGGHSADYEVTAATFEGALRMVASDPDNAPAVNCPSCEGLGEFQESFALKRYDARVIDCPDCQGRRRVSADVAAQLILRGKPVMPDGWVA